MQQRVEPFQTTAQHVVIIVAPGVTRNPRQLAVIHAGGIRARGVVQLAGTNDGTGRRQKPPRVRAHFGAPVGEVPHLSSHAGMHPVAEVGELGHWLGGGHAGQLETALACQFPNRSGSQIRPLQISNPTDRISSMALLLRTTPGRMM